MFSGGNKGAAKSPRVGKANNKEISSCFDARLRIGLHYFGGQSNFLYGQEVLKLEFRLHFVYRVPYLRRVAGFGVVTKVGIQLIDCFAIFRSLAVDRCQVEMG